MCSSPRPCRAGELLLATVATEEPPALARRAMAADEWSEPARALLVSAHLAAGDQGAARVALEDCYRMLFAIGAQPDARTRVLARHLGRDDSAPPTGRTAVAG
jgi:DNA-binding SARP family transcriptional activator